MTSPEVAGHLCLLQAAKRQKVAAVVESLEALNPLQQPTQHLDRVAGSWNLLYTTITITVGRWGPHQTC